MAKSRSLGHSSSRTRDSDGTELARLKKLAASNSVNTIRKALGAAAKLHLVGGTVRDTLVGLGGIDLDLASALTPQENLARLQRAGIHVVQTGIEHGTVTAVIAAENIEITSFRKPGKREQFECSDCIE